MIKSLEVKHSWSESFKALFQRQVFFMLLLGFSAGLPLMLIFSSLSLWLGEAGINKSTVTYFSWAALGYSFKFVWAPLVDCLPLPFLTKLLGLRRSWLLLAQLGIISAICLMASSNPVIETHLTWMAIGAVLLGFSAATQDISIDAYRIEVASADMQGLLSAAYIAGFRIAMIVAGAGALYLASYLGSTKEQYLYEAWQLTYFTMALLGLVGVFATFLISEPIKRESQFSHTANEYLGLLGAFFICVAGFVVCFYLTRDVSNQLKAVLSDVLSNKALSGFIIELLRLSFALMVAFVFGKLCIVTGVANRQMLVNSYVSPVKQFFDDYGVKTAWWLLALIGLYRISDIVLGVMSNLFYQDLGFTKVEIADAVKFFGLAMTIVGGFMGGVWVMRYGVMRVLFVSALLVVITNMMFIVLYFAGKNMMVLYAVVSADNLVAGVATAAFIAFLSSLVNVKFTAMQYAIFSSLMTLIPKVLAGYSGSIVESIGYPGFFIFTGLIGLPILVLVVMVQRSLDITERSVNQENAAF
ncbi:AmpG family muropeptide MFS transporter [Pseudomonas sp. HK3]